MSFNEKRAHDIAIACLPIDIKLSIDSAINSGKTSEGVDIYAMYKKIYDSTLKQLNQDYPLGST